MVCNSQKHFWSYFFLNAVEIESKFTWKSLVVFCCSILCLIQLNWNWKTWMPGETVSDSLMNICGTLSTPHWLGQSTVVWGMPEIFQIFATSMTLKDIQTRRADVNIIHIIYIFLLFVSYSSSTVWNFKTDLTSDKDQRPVFRWYVFFVFLGLSFAVFLQL